MKRLKKIILYFVLTILLLFLFRGFLYRTIVNYSIVGNRNSIALNDSDLTIEIDRKIEGKTLNIEEIIELSNELTNEKLNFTFEKCSSNPNEVIDIKKSNCIGYSALFNSIGNYIISKQNMNDSIEFKHLIGKLKILGYDLHDMIDDSFFKDHDFNEIWNKRTNEKIYVDPSLSDYFWIDEVTVK